jgi:hypothetical protein
MKRLLMWMILVVVAPAAGLARQAIPEQGAPPTNLQQRDGYWTANGAPPEDAGNFQVHTVVAGDTLWAIANAYMNDPFLWPQLWEANTHIVNPHWIYPEDAILIRPVTDISTVVPPPPPQDPEPAAPRVVQFPTLTDPNSVRFPGVDVSFDVPEPEPIAPVKSSDLYCSGFVTTRGIETVSSRVIGRVPPGEGLMFSDGRYAYVSRGSSDGVQPGDILSVVRPTRNINSTRDGVGQLGRHYLEMGQVRAIMVQPAFSLVRVIHSCGDITLGDTVTEFREIDFPELPSNRPFSPFMQPGVGAAGEVAMTLDPLHTQYTPALGGVGLIAGHVRLGHGLEGVRGGIAAGGRVVYLDIGAQDGVETGDLFLIYRPMEFDNRRGLVRIPSEARDLLAGEQYAIGEVVVLKVEERAATALITFSSDGVSPGDLVAPRPR